MNVDIISLLSTDGYIMCNKTLIKLFGADCAILVGELCAEYNYYKAREELNEYNEFFSTQENIEDMTGLNPYSQRKALKVLQDNGIITVTRRGVPAKNFYGICENKLLDIFTTRCLNFKELEVQNLNINNNNNKNNKNNTSTNVEVETKKSTKKLSLYDKCFNAITDSIDDEKEIIALDNFLKFRLEIKDKPLYVNQWKGLLKKYNSLVTTNNLTLEQRIKVINQSIENGWLSFYELKSGNAYNKSANVFSEYGRVKCDRGTDDIVGEF